MMKNNLTLSVTVIPPPPPRSGLTASITSRHLNKGSNTSRLWEKLANGPGTSQEEKKSVTVIPTQLHPHHLQTLEQRSNTSRLWEKLANGPGTSQEEKKRSGGSMEEKNHNECSSRKKKKKNGNT
ncbi:hypothetical protein CDAR_17421 [Caerostris darwini]|uniref:Uncharacterized protein n=1 Tax=Caerostris darwini TaxID=1538125 RepID=A0AAV4VDI7_9ARAC|nr:hypothetical protein CDAR_17421 [Caerostris darwini]